MISKEAVLKALSNVEDPDLKKDLVTLNMIQKLEIEGHKVSFDLVLTTPACPMKDMLHNACVNAVKLLVDSAAEVNINITHNMKPQENAEIKGVKHIIAVASGKGGVGKSTVAAGLAMSLRSKGATVGLLDADIYGPSIPTLFNLYEPPEVLKQDGVDMMIPHEKYGIKLLSIGFLTNPGQAVVWRGPMVSSAFKQFTRDVIWGDLDYLIIDLPPGHWRCANIPEPAQRGEWRGYGQYAATHEYSRCGARHRHVYPASHQYANHWHGAKFKLLYSARTAQ